MHHHHPHNTPHAHSYFHGCVQTHENCKNYVPQIFVCIRYLSCLCALITGFSSCSRGALLHRPVLQHGRHHRSCPPQGVPGRVRPCACRWERGAVSPRLGCGLCMLVHVQGGRGGGGACWCIYKVGGEGAEHAVMPHKLLIEKLSVKRKHLLCSSV